VAPARVRVRLNIVPGKPPDAAELAKLGRTSRAGVVSEMARLEEPLVKYLKGNRQALAHFVSDPIAVLRSAVPDEGELIDRIAAARAPSDSPLPHVADVELTSVEVTMEKRRRRGESTSGKESDA
jgi:hypothetical protein